jgi:hypothetical protein
MENLPKVINNRSIHVFVPAILVCYSATPILDVLRKILILYLKFGITDYNKFTYSTLQKNKHTSIML